MCLAARRASPCFPKYFVCQARSFASSLQALSSAKALCSREARSDMVSRPEIVIRCQDKKVPAPELKDVSQSQQVRCNGPRPTNHGQLFQMLPSQVDNLGKRVGIV